ncbi:MAG TPA: type II secretion system protein GspM [Azospirillaceae bacterium]|nr:type II secretion system protein GspM [Azospirillaceae bacterium]
MNTNRLFALGLLALVLGAVGVFAALPAGLWVMEQGDGMAQAQATLERYRRLAADRDTLAHQRDELVRRASTRGLYLQGTGDALAAAALQNQVKGIVARHGGTLQSTQILPAREEQGFQRIAVRSQMQVGIVALHRILHALEAGEPALFLDNVDIIARGARGADSVTATDLDVRFDAYGYRRVTSP